MKPFDCGLIGSEGYPAIKVQETIHAGVLFELVGFGEATNDLQLIHITLLDEIVSFAKVLGSSSISKGFILVSVISAKPLQYFLAYE